MQHAGNMLLDAKYFLKNNRNIMFFKIIFYKIFTGELIFELQKMHVYK